ncbi:MAG: TIGR00282 family metallophosphoesterase [Clostridia bacterium]|nr:TIGR00282 family metallophosphoesterase [Clostridia bacterium]
MKFLLVGDVVGNSGMSILKNNLKEIIKKESIDFCIINGENSASGRGIKEKQYKELLELGADVVTMGNHLYYRKEAAKLYEEEERLLIPANVTNLKGKGSIVVEKNGVKVAVINLLGKVYMGEVNNDFVTCPFKEVKKQLEILKKDSPDYIFLDFHAEATAEKKAMGQYLKEDITCLFGTHTHVQTSDEEIIEGSMAYITDVGMTGPKDSVIGLKTEIALARFVTGEKIKYECSESEPIFNSVIVTTEDNTKKPVSIKRYNI